LVLATAVRVVERGIKGPIRETQEVLAPAATPVATQAAILEVLRVREKALLMEAQSRAGLILNASASSSLLR